MSVVREPREVSRQEGASQQEQPDRIFDDCRLTEKRPGAGWISGRRAIFRDVKNALNRRIGCDRTGCDWHGRDWRIWLARC